MNKFLSSFWGGGLLLLCACDQPVPAAPATAPEATVHILCFGDSLTAGKDLSDPDTQSYPAVLERRLKAQGLPVRVTNAGQSGDTTFDALARLDFALADRPDVVIVCLGSNDRFQSKKLSDTQTNLEEIIGRAQAKGATVLLTPLKIYINLGFGAAARYEAMFKNVAKKKKAVLTPFPLAGVVTKPSMNLSDGIHPNPAGYEKFVDNIYDDVENAVRKKLKK